jgi:hypothetical protein
MDVFTALSAIPGIGPFLPYAAVLVAVAAPLATVLPAPQPAAGWVYVTFHRIVTVLAWNFGRAKNEGLK